MSNISKYASTPKLVKVELDDADLVKKYGEPIVFHMYDIMPLSIYFEFFNAKGDDQFAALDGLMKRVILNDKGKPALSETEELPVDIASAVILYIGEQLGKSQTK